jgi:site-specific DNA-methyltransferase (adenine-specific)
MKQIKLMQGDNILSLKKLPENSIDSIVTDPPYGLSFMNKKWDYEVPSIEFWKEVYRVLKPGGHVLSFGGTRTYHRMVVNIEDAGFEIRDQIMWIYGSGFPKSLNIGKAFDKKNGNEREVTGTRLADDITSGNMHTNNKGQKATIEITKGSSQYEGWGTALKPANEPICLARKPLSEKTIVDNVIKWGTGGINVDGCSIGTETIMTNMKNTKGGLYNLANEQRTNEVENTFNEGRFPANILFDEAAAQVLDEQSGKLNKQGKSKTDNKSGWQNDYVGGNGVNPVERKLYLDDNGGGASRFFYVAKVSKKERNLGLDNFEEVSDNAKGNGLNRICDKCSAPQLKPCDCKDNSWVTPAMKNSHPTLKPINLMTYLCRLITPPGGIVLDPFMGSGSTGISACLEGFRFVGMELQEDYFKIAEARINNFEEYRKLLK